MCKSPTNPICTPNRFGFPMQVKTDSRNSQSEGKRFGVSNRVDAILSSAVLLVSLTLYSWHWLTTQPDIHHDASRLGMHAVDLLEEGVIPFYIYHQYASYPFIVYLQSLAFAVFGYSDAVVQGVTVVGGALAPPAIYWASLWFFQDQGRAFARRAGLVAALGLALSTSFAFLSHAGNETILLPVFELAAVALLWRGFRRGRKLYFVLAGLIVGVSQYVYIVALFFPVVLAAACAVAILANRQLLASWRGLVLGAGSAALIALPQWILFVTFPYTLSARVSGPDETAGGQFVFGLSDPIAVVGNKLTSQLLALCCYWNGFDGTITWASLLTPVLFAGLVVGIAVVIWQRRDGYLFCLGLMVVSLLPELLTYEKYDPAIVKHRRLILAIPFFFVIAGLGVATDWGWIEERRRLPCWTGYLILALVLTSGLYRQWDFATRVRPVLFTIGGHQLEYSKVVEYIGDHLDEPILLPTYQYHFRHALFAFLLAGQFPQRQAGEGGTLKQGENVTVVQLRMHNDFPEDWVLLKDGTVYFLPPSPGIVEPQDGERMEIVGSNGDVVAESFKVRWQGNAPAYIPVEAAFENHLHLVGYQGSDFEPGSRLKATFYWQPTQRIERDVELVVQLYDPFRKRYVVDALIWPLSGAYRVRAWRPDQIMPLSHSLRIPDDLSPGRYELKVGVFDLIGRERIPLVTGEDIHIVKRFKVPLPRDDRVPEVYTGFTFGDLIALSGYTLTPTDDGLKITFFWRAMKAPEVDYTSFVHLVDADGQIVAQEDMQPLGGLYPTSIWSPGELIVEERTFPSIPDGEYRIFIGWYIHRDGGWERLPAVSEGSSSADDRAFLDTIRLP